MLKMMQLPIIKKTVGILNQKKILIIKIIIK